MFTQCVISLLSIRRQRIISSKGRIIRVLRLKFLHILISSNQLSFCTYQASKILPSISSSVGFSSSQYGAIFFTHESDSLISGQNLSLSYNDAVMSQCRSSTPSNYTSDCSRFVGGISYLVSTNFTSLHSSLVYQALADEAILRKSLSDDTYSIQSSIYPLPITKVESTLGRSQVRMKPAIGGI